MYGLGKNNKIKTVSNECVYREFLRPEENLLKA